MLISAPPRAVVPLLLAASLLLQAGCASAPADGTSSAARTEDELAAMHTRLGIGYLREGQTERAFERLQRALDADPGYAPAHNVMAVVYEELNEPREAERHYRRAVRLDPTNSKAHNNFGRFLCRRGRYEEAEKHFLKAVQNPLYVTSQAAYTNAGRCMRRAGETAKAEQYLRKALQIDPKFPEALLSMADISYERGRILSARGYLQRYQEVGPKTPPSLWLGVRIERALGDRNAASSYAMLLRNNYPDSREAQLLQESETR
ncbi:MAG: type IV pilus biogenesis/stability protein PilW [Gammaproteobacteria bacterium]|nr:type IV pilus biogenesis/stability protein PilW [Gammaproteobacteria bacterium]NIR81861.1 type IV pilus biogenesis/stability protein PilW [Gammaproteobacteria bacterium]NIR88693.1 type IV pilus biogenesis/stability protein PilW [Gammaproteobacteria bacterium]NIU02969.1 type IV pilus biogenesis/stability protein PilW [Gammaproteobacteria bacterium]NIV50490.1 type IV pilus biogenesis/stability protein PilW [Gammaproteobacteria bacterium]